MAIIQRPAAVVLAAGKGTRMRSQHPKVVHNVAGEPMVGHSLRLLHRLGIPPRDIVIVIGHGADEVQAVLANPAPYIAGTPAEDNWGGETYQFAVQAEQRGTAHAVLTAKPYLLERSEVNSILILYADTPLLQALTVQALLTAHYSADDPALIPFLTLLTAYMPDPTGYGRIIRDGRGRVTGIVEEKDATSAQRAINETNTGIYAARPDFVWSALEMVRPSPVSGEYYLTDLVAMAASSRKAESELTPQHSRVHQIARSVICYVGGKNDGGERISRETLDSLLVLPDADALNEFHGINDRAQLARANHAFHQRITNAHMIAGVTITDPANTYIGAMVEIGADSTIEPNTHLRGRTVVGTGCIIGPNTILNDATIGDGCTILASVIEDSALDDHVEIGPFSRLRGGTHVEKDVHIGNFAEMKNTRFGAGSKMGHFSYLGDATVGTNVNIGAGSITANYDGTNKHPTHIGANAFIGSDTIMRAPLTIGEGAGTGAGSVVTKDVPDGAFVVGVPARPFNRNNPKPDATNDRKQDAEA